MENNKSPEPLFIPAAITGLAAYPLFFIGAMSGDARYVIAAGISWGASIALWKTNKDLGGNVPWPENIDDIYEMTDNISVFRKDD